MSIDRRLLERQKVVAEDKARRTVGRLLRVIVFLTVIGAVVWLMFSPMMSVEEVATSGVVSSDTGRVLIDHGVVAGTPMILIRTDSVEAELESDPWIVDARVEIDWPNRVTVRIEERTPAAWVQTQEGWARRATDGVALPSASEPDDTLGWVRMRDFAETAAESSPAVLGAIEFVDSLPGELSTDVIVRVEDNGELWAVVSGYQVRLGRPVEMSEKARSLTALLEHDPPRRAVLTLIAPSHPAVTPMESLTDEDQLTEREGDDGEGAASDQATPP